MATKLIFMKLVLAQQLPFNFMKIRQKVQSLTLGHRLMWSSREELDFCFVKND